MQIFAGKYMSDEDFARMKEEIASIKLTDEDIKQINSIIANHTAIYDRNMKEINKEYYEGMPKAPFEDEEYLKEKLSSYPSDHVFTEEELDSIAKRGFPGMKKMEYIDAYDTGNPNAFDKKERLKYKTDEEIVTFCERYAGKNHEAPIFKNFYNLCMGYISSREYNHNINKRLVMERFKKIHNL